MAIPTATSTSSCLGPTDVKPSKPWPENDAYGAVVTALVGLIVGMLLGIIGRELWPRRGELLMAALLPLIWTPIVWFMVELFLRMCRGVDVQAHHGRGWVTF